MTTAVPVRERARLLHQQAVDEYNRGKPTSARRSLDRALAVLGSDPDPAHPEARSLAVRIWMTAALCDADLIGIDAGRQALDRAENLAATIDDANLEQLIKGNRGLIEMRGGDLSRALVELDRAVELLEHSAPLGQITALLNRGTVLMFRGELLVARTDLVRAVEIARAAGRDVEVHKALHNLGYLEFLAGDLPLALQRMDEALRVETGQEWGMVYLDRARVLSEAGLGREADEALAEAGRIFGRDRLVQDLAEVELERARSALVAGDVAGARRLAARARDRFRRRGSDRWRREAELVLLQGDLAAGRPGRRLAPPALRLRDELEADGRRLSAATAARLAAEALLTAGQPQQAREVLAGAPAGAGEPITARLHDRFVRARLEAEGAGGSRRAAERHVRAGLADLTRYQAGFGSIDLQTAAAVHGRRLAELGLGLALGSGRPAAVFAAAERARAVSTRLPLVEPPQDPESAALLSDLRQVVEELRGAAENGTAAQSLRQRRRQLERRVAERRWTLAGKGDVAAITTPAAVAEQLQRSAGRMLMFVEAADLLHALVLDGDRTRLTLLGAASAVHESVRRARADLDALAHPTLPEPMRRAVSASSARTAATLDALLLGPLGPMDRPLVIASTGLLGQVPWGLLPSLRGVPATVAPSATAWLAAHTRPRPRRRFTVGALAGPDLDRAAHEAKAVVEAWTGRAELLDGSGPDLARALTRHGLVHVAAHGTHQTENPLFSSLRLTDGAHFAHELDQSERVPEHVVLSACELGLATVRPGDEALGLAAVLLQLGTRSVVAGVARVGDETAEQAMLSYHRGLAAGLDSASALAVVTEHLPVPFVNFGSAWSAPGVRRASARPQTEFGKNDTRHVP